MSAGYWGWTADQDPVIATAMELGASQEPAELGMAARMLAALPARVIVEIGCDRGGTLYVWRQIAAQVYGITSTDNGYEAGGSGLPLVTHGAVVRFGDSHDPESVAWLARQLAMSGDAPVDALVIDGDHSLRGVLADVADYGPLVRPGGVILLHDIRSTQDTRVEVPKAWSLLTERHETSQLVNIDGGPGWGVIHVRENESYQRSPS